MSAVETLATVLLLLLTIWSATATLNALWPLRNVVVLIPSMLWSWFVIGLPVQTLVFQMMGTALLVAAGALASPLGWACLGVLVVSWVGTGFVLFQIRGASGIVDSALVEAGVARTKATVPTWRVLLAIPLRGRSVTKVSGIEFRRVAGRTLRLDVFHNGSQAEGRPVLMYIHGGGWVVGDKREQGLPLMHHLARHGWVCVSVNYRLSPGATWPDHLIDAKAGLAWIRQNIGEYGGDPSFVAVAGGSAGGHLAAMVGLTENLPVYQPGFEDADTAVNVVVPIYGIYDTTNRMGVQSSQFVPLLMEPLVIKAYLTDEPEKFLDASPIDRIHADAPVFVIPQGDRDTLAPVEEARAFVERLRSVSGSRVVYMEFRGAQHIFDLAYSQQSSAMIEGVLSVLEDERARLRDRGEPSERRRLGDVDHA